MSEGGILNWKRQQIRSKPSIESKSILLPLPDPPKGFEWICAEERTWSIREIPGGLNPDVSDMNIARTGNDDKEVLQQSGELAKAENEADSEESPPSYDQAMNTSPSHDQIMSEKYVEHIITPNDTFQGICLRYKVSAVKLRQVNQFSGSSLSFAPRKLYVPVSADALSSGAIKPQDRSSDEFKVFTFLAELGNLGTEEARYYLELNDWDVDGALVEARNDILWEEKECGKSMTVHTGVRVGCD